ncbi:hypothetical protein KBC14_03520 [Candidatus Woesebacteria bacterium]|jgi:hypothetical protein|nr:hypothetical protein [Candidatus Woesebacteria bacterium]MBP6883433.1 hypothetical protein [Candidatus Woesebacteria bacterium]
MATIVNNPAPAGDSNGSSGLIIGVLLIIVLAGLFYVYGLPSLSRVQSPQINIPNKIDVNVKQNE